MKWDFQVKHDPLRANGELHSFEDRETENTCVSLVSKVHCSTPQSANLDGTETEKKRVLVIHYNLTQFMLELIVEMHLLVVFVSGICL